MSRLICVECIGENAIWVQFHATLEFSIPFMQPVDTLIRNVWWFLVARNFRKLSAKFLLGTSRVKKYIEQSSKESTTKTPTVQVPPTPTTHCYNNHMIT